MPGPPPKPKDPTSGKPTASSEPKRLSCVSCRARKVRCDRLLPCAPCTRSGLTCVFPKPAPPRQRTGAKARSAEIQSRLSRLEGLVGAMGGEKVLEQRRVAMEARREGRGVMEAAEGEGEGSVEGVVRGVGHLGGEGGEEVLKREGGRWLSGDFWSNLSTEVDGLKELLNEPPEDEGDDGDDAGDGEERDTVSSPSTSITDPNSAGSPSLHFIFQGGDNQVVDLASVYPYPALVTALFETYFNRFDPTFKVLHKPTVYTLLSSISYDVNRPQIKGGQEALVFAMFYAAVTCSAPDEVYKLFGEEKTVVAKRYERATETALTNADFLNSTKIVTLQAFIIYLACNRSHTESRQPWTLLALVVRIAYAMDLHCDGEQLKLSVYETEIRRRLFWAIILLDVQGSEDRGSAPIVMEHTFDTRMPLNINDEDLDPVHGVTRPEYKGCTQMTFCLICYESSRALQILAATQPRRRTFVPVYTPSQEDRERRVNDVSTKLHSRFIVHCNTALPMDWFCSMVAQIIILKFFLLSHYPVFTKAATIAVRPKTRPSQESLLSTSISLLELQHRLEHSGVSWSWFARNFVQWHPLAVTLAILCGMPPGGSAAQSPADTSSDINISPTSTSRPNPQQQYHSTPGKHRGESTPLVQRAWAIVDVVFDEWSNRVADKKTGNLWMPVRKLLERARLVHGRPVPSRKSNSPFSSSSQGGPRGYGSGGAQGGQGPNTTTTASHRSPGAVSTTSSTHSGGPHTMSALGLTPATTTTTGGGEISGITPGTGAADLNIAELQRLGINNVPQPPAVHHGASSSSVAGSSGFDPTIGFNPNTWNPALGIGLAGVEGQLLYDQSVAMALDGGPYFSSAAGTATTGVGSGGATASVSAHQKPFLGGGGAAGVSHSSPAGSSGADGVTALHGLGADAGAMDLGGLDPTAASSDPGMARGGFVVPPEGNTPVGSDGLPDGSGFGPAGMDGVQMMDSGAGWAEWERFLGGEYGGMGGL